VSPPADNCELQEVGRHADRHPKRAEHYADQAPYPLSHRCREVNRNKNSKKRERVDQTDRNGWIIHADSSYDGNRFADI
jgi:hypothetical protein